MRVEEARNKLLEYILIGNINESTALISSFSLYMSGYTKNIIDKNGVLEEGIFFYSKAIFNA
ncbi:MAG: hypothetical protein ACD_79C00230G0002 [uncultured bacterium]|nr:MAG: hypothetical protein ACD_79C00230G0002 [uncultured bacterium]